MDTKTKLRALIQSMDQAQLGILADELSTEVDGRRPQINLEDITAERLKDPDFAARVRTEIETMLKEVR